MSDLAKQLRETTHMYQADCELKMKCAARIDELEEKLLSAIIDGYDMAKYEYRDRIKELEVKLSRAVEALDEAVYLLAPDEKDMMRQAGVYRVVTTLAELKGQKDEWKCPINHPNCEENCGDYGCGN